MTLFRQDDPLPLSTRLLYAPLGALLWIIAHTPFRLAYFGADILAWLAGSVVKYRRSLVRRNIADSFPEMTEKERRKTERGFYRHLADYFIETVKFSAMSERDIMKHIRFENTDEIDSLFDAGKNMAIYTSHYGNWEWITSMGLWCRHKDAIYGHVYRPLTNRWFDRFFLRIRSRFNLSIPLRQVFQKMARMKAGSEKFIVGFLSDQKPDITSTTVTTEFLSRPTPFTEGTEKLARRLGLALLYFDMRSDRRGYYTARIVKIADNAADLEEGEATRRYAALLEKSIRRNPALYLWSHNRWRLPRKPHRSHRRK